MSSFFFFGTTSGDKDNKKTSSKMVFDKNFTCFHCGFPTKFSVWLQEWFSVQLNKTLPNNFTVPCHFRRKCWSKMEEMARAIQKLHHWNGNYWRQAERSPVVALRWSTSRQDFPWAPRRWWWKRLQQCRRKIKCLLLSTSQHFFQSL